MGAWWRIAAVAGLAFAMPVFALPALAQVDETGELPSLPTAEAPASPAAAPAAAPAPAAYQPTVPEAVPQQPVAIEPPASVLTPPTGEAVPAIAPAVAPGATSPATGVAAEPFADAPSPAMPSAPSEAMTVDGAVPVEAEALAEPEPAPEPYVSPVMVAVRLRGTNKVNAKSEEFDAVLGGTTEFGGLEIVARSCWQSPPDARPESAALLDIWERKHKEAPAQIFVGWMFASSPSISALEHPVYDVTVLKCIPVGEGEELP